MAKTSQKQTAKEKRMYISQSDMPRLSLSETIRLAQSLYDDFAGKSGAPHQLAIAVNMSPTSPSWDRLCGAAIAHGLNEGGSHATKITMTDLGRRIVAPTEEGDDERAKAEAVLRPRIIREFLQKYDRAKFPSDKIARNVLVDIGVPQDRLDEALQIIKANGESVGIIKQTKTGPFIAIEIPLESDDAITEQKHDIGVKVAKEETKADEQLIKASPPRIQERERVFISHGKNKEIVAQLKALLTFGKLEPVVAEEHETPSKPVSDKVMDDMRVCFAGIIHIESEEQLTDQKGNISHKLNENVLIEIGAALALYRRNVILLVPRGITLPSNLQGLYYCYYEGEKLDYDATMKLLKAFNEFQ